LFDLPRGIRKNSNNLNHYRRDCIHHFFVRWHRDVDFETSKKSFYAFEYFNQSLLACTNIFSCLSDVEIRMACAKALVRHKPKEGHRIQKRSSSRARMPVKCT
jgi:hypothetical protein